MKLSAAVLSVILALALFTAPVPSPGQQPGKVYRIGFLGGAAPAPDNTNPQGCPIKGSPYWQALVAGLRERGYVWDQNLVIECRYSEGRTERAPALAAELVNLKPDLMVVAFTDNVRAVKQATTTLPIVMVQVIDPVGRGLVASLARPGGNVTGLALTAGMEMMGKYLQLLKEAVPAASRVAVLNAGTGTPAPLFRKEIEAAAPGLQVTLEFYRVGDPAEFEGVFAAMTKARMDAILVIPHPFVAMHAQRIVDLATQRRMPVVSDSPFVPVGGLLSYHANQFEILRRVGFYVDRILKGANPGDLPVEQPMKFELLINLKAAKALGLTIPQSLLMRADEVIE